jgi:hypothetical protein
MLLERIMWLKSVQSQSYVTTDGQSASLSWNKTPVWGLLPDFYYCQTVAGLLMWALTLTRVRVLSVAIAPGLPQRSHFRIQVPWDSWPYFTVSDSRLPFSSSTTRSVNVEVFDPVSTREVCTKPSPILFYHSRRSGYEAPPWRILYFVYAATVCLSTRCHGNTCSSTATNMPSRALSWKCMYNNSMLTRCHGNMLC